MAVPFYFPEENNNVDVIITQLNVLLNRLAVEFKKQRNENIQLRARNKLQSAGGRQCSHASQDQHTVVSDTVLSAIATCKRFTVPHADDTTARTFEDAKNSEFEKNPFFDHQTNQEFAQVEEDEVDGQVSFFGVSWESCRQWWSRFLPRNLTTNKFWTTTVICVVGWHLLR